ncbi:PREDICTED: nuclear autoantigen Sp-100-like [Dipodomys ordii]|uniref:Nuclear autoantigen Sp-100-like n=1 Tax=Dipodomys ordii TaxID=10020 RepID=A0A1S3FII4_DIPOR|nr:PREDICTED: nuclear autoantigen Sp-100-like [Dipodomys ordii]
MCHNDSIIWGRISGCCFWVHWQITVTKKEIKDILFKHYKKFKVEISKAIIKPFPFLEGLRDREHITNEMYEDCQDSFRNLTPLHKVVYKVLLEMEKAFDMEVLDALFSQVNMQEYPELTLIHQSFVYAIQKSLNIQEGDGEEADERSNRHLRMEQGFGENSFIRSLIWSSDHLSSYGSILLENELTEGHHTQQTDGRQANGTHDHNDESGCQEAIKQQTQESTPAESQEQEAAYVDPWDASLQPPSPLACIEERVRLPSHETQMSSCSVLLVDIKKENPFNYWSAEQPAGTRTRHDQASDIIEISSDDSKGSNDEDEPAETLPRSQPAINNHSLLGLHEKIEEQEATCSQPQLAPESIDFRKSVTFQKRLGQHVRGHDWNSSESSEEDLPPVSWLSAPRKEPGETNSMDIGKASTWRKHKRKRHAMDGGNTSTLAKDRGEKKKVRKQRRQVKQAQPGRKETNVKRQRKSRKRGPRIPREENVDFFSPELAVTCGDAKGILHMKKFKQSVLVRSIQSEDGRWFTPREFEIKGKFEASKNWRLSVRCHGWPLKELIKKGILPDPPRKKQNTWSHNQTLIDSYLTKQVGVKYPSKGERWSL